MAFGPEALGTLYREASSRRFVQLVVECGEEAVLMTRHALALNLVSRDEVEAHLRRAKRGGMHQLILLIVERLDRRTTSMVDELGLRSLLPKTLWSVQPGGMRTEVDGHQGGGAVLRQLSGVSDETRTAVRRALISLNLPMVPLHLLFEDLPTWDEILPILKKCQGPLTTSVIEEAWLKGCTLSGSLYEDDDGSPAAYMLGGFGTFEREARMWHRTWRLWEFGGTYQAQADRRWRRILAVLRKVRARTARLPLQRFCSHTDGRDLREGLVLLPDARCRDLVQAYYDKTHDDYNAYPSATFEHGANSRGFLCAALVPKLAMGVAGLLQKGVEDA